MRVLIPRNSRIEPLNFKTGLLLALDANSVLHRRVKHGERKLQVEIAAMQSHSCIKANEWTGLETFC